MLVDSHAHLDHEKFTADLDGVLKRASEAGVRKILTVGCLADGPDTVRLFFEILNRDQVVGAIGLHPHDAKYMSDEQMAFLTRCMNHPKICGWGEIGLDFHYNFSTPDEQISAFRRQLRVAREVGKPVIIHMREAEDQLLEILESENRRGDWSGVFHCFSSDSRAADWALELGFYLSFGGILSFKTAEELREIAKRVPEDRFLIETDCPYLAPVPYRGNRNEPAYVKRVAEVMAELRGIEPAAVAKQSVENFKRLFSVDV